MVVKLNETTLKKIVFESVKKVLKETELSYDMDNFSGKWSRGDRYNILVDGEVYYKDVPEVSVDKLVNQLEKRGYQNVTVVDLNDESSEQKELYDDSEKTYDIVAMIKSDMNPISQTFKAKNIEEAIIKAKKYFSGFSNYGEKDVDIFYVKNNDYNGI